jgi:hypothetical protein
MRFASASSLLSLAVCLFAPFALACAASADDVPLWDNGPPDGRNGLPCLCWPAYHIDWEVVDDFTLGWPGSTYMATGGHFSLVTDHAQGPEAIQGVKVFFYEDQGDRPSTSRHAERDCQFSAYLIGAYYLGMPEIAVDVSFSEVRLAEKGTWWVCFQPTIDAGAYWLTASGNGRPVYVSYPDYGYPKWTDCHAVFGENYDVSFAVYGYLANFPPETYIDLPAGDLTIRTGQYVEFAGTAWDANGYAVEWLWTFGEGSGIDDMHVEDPGLVQFNNPGVFTVTFNAKDNYGDWDPTPAHRIITVDDTKPDAVIDLPAHDVTIYGHQSVEFAGTATDLDGYIVDWLWTFGEGSGIPDMHLEDPGLVQFNNVGVFTVTFNAQDNDGNWDPNPDKRVVTVKPGDPDAVIDLPAGDVVVHPGDCVEFAGTASDPNGYIADWLWTFGEGSGIEDMHVEDPGLVQFNNIGVFTVTFNAQDDEGNWDPTPQERSIRVTLSDVLWDQLAASSWFFASQDYEPVFDCYDIWAADDFTVDEPGWIIESCDWTAAFDHGYATVNWVNFYVWRDRGDGYADFYSGPIWNESGLYGKTLYDGDVHYDFATPAVLDPGHYIFGVQPAFDFELWGQHWWVTTAYPPKGTAFSMINPGGCLGMGSDWFPGTPGPDASFRLYGQIVPCIPTDAPDPEPYCEGALFGRPAGGYPAWVWFSIPLDPTDCCGQGNCYDPETLLGFTCGGRLWYWDKYSKTSQVYKPPFLSWDLAVGNGYLLYLEADVENPGYAGVIPDSDFQVKLGRQGWTWVGMPGLVELGHPDFMDAVEVEYPVGGAIRTAGEDYGAAPNNWVSWGWSFWDTWSQAPRAFTPYAVFGCNTCYPWIGYRVWVNVGTAMSPDDPDQVTLIWPQSQ